MGKMNQSFSWADPPPEEGSVPIDIKVIGVGGGGGNAINTMAVEGLREVTLLAANTDKQALCASKAGQTISSERPPPAGSAQGPGRRLEQAPRWRVQRRSGSSWRARTLCS